MHKQNIVVLQDIVRRLEELNLQAVLDDEQGEFEGRPESWQESDAGQEAAEALSELESAVDDLDNLIARLQDLAPIPRK